MSKALATDTETYMKRIQAKASPHAQQLEELNQTKEAIIKTTLTDIQNLQVQKQLQDMKDSISPNKSLGDAAQNLFKDKSPAEVLEILQNLTPDMIQKIKMLSENPANALLLQQHQQQPTNRDDMILKYLLEKEDKSMEKTLAIIKMVKEMSPTPPVQTPSNPQGSMESAVGMIKIVQELQRPFYESMSNKDKELMDVKLKEIESRMPGSLDEQIKYVKDMAGALGFGGKQTSDLDLKLEEMRQNKDLDDRKLNWEQKKYEIEQEADNQKWDKIAGILKGPLGDVIKNMGNAGADRVRGSRGNPSRIPKPVQTQCPNCDKVIFVDPEADTAVCALCGAVLQKGGGETPPAVKEDPSTTHVAEQSPPVVQVQNQEEATTEEEEAGHQETESKEPEPKQ